MTTEMKSQPRRATVTPGTNDIDPQSLAAIRSLMETEPEAAPQPVADRQPVQTGQPVQTIAGQAAPAGSAHKRSSQKPSPASARGDGLPDLSQEGKDPAAPGLIDRAKARLLGYRPTPKHLIIASLVLCVLLRPWLFVGFVFFGFVFVIGIFLILGYDGFWKRAMAIGRWYAGRRPARAAELHRKLDDFAMKWDGILDRFPEGTVDGLYLPDFGELATAEARHDAALDRRLATMREGEA